ncbi:hypothetical protein K466DRAFT_606132 [Polyporus arcularius HHB13444]|uniref:DUF6534 domain-containing protein n=1 Tax=Polyporus arcularius HHB13444 TaxID=1314778 RepID=A0A5C3NSS4_9APHY|nr:hypothetical protein K466DRAFT_606132 [Polyporus arcularius HHB13444]
MSIVDETMGALLVGVILSAIFWGVSCCQMYYYYSQYRDDALPLKVLVLAVWVTDSAHQGLISHSIYTYLVSDYGNPVAITLLNESIIVEVMFNAMTGLLVQSFFVLRVWRLCGRKLYLVAPVVLLIAAEFGEHDGLSICMNIFAAVADVTIAAILCTLLHRSRTKFARSNHLINKLTVFAVNTGLLTSVCACASLLTFFVIPKSFIYITFYFLIGRLYCNSLLATLNARKSLSGRSTDDQSISLRNMQAPPPALLTSHHSRAEGGIAIRIQKDTTTTVDYEVDSDPFKVTCNNIVAEAV